MPKESIYLIISLFFLNISIKAQDSTKTHQLESIEVIGKNRPDKITSTIPIQIATRSSIDRIGIQSVSDAVRRFAGIVVKDYGGIGGLKTISIRGNGANHTSVLYDGVPLNNGQTGQIDIGKLSLQNIDMISLTIGQSDDIFRSAKSVSSVGVIDVSTRVPDFTKKNFKIISNIKTGSWGLFNPYLYCAKKFSESLSMSIDAEYTRSDGKYRFETINGKYVTTSKRINNQIENYRAEANIFGKIGKNQNIAFKTYFYDTYRGIPSVIILQVNGIREDYDTARLTDRTIFSQIKYSNNINRRLKFQATAKYTSSYTKYVEHLIIPGNVVPTNKYWEKDLYLSSTFLYHISDLWSVSVAEDFSYNNISTYMNSYNGMENENASVLKRPARYSSLSAISSKYKNNYLTVIASLLGTYISDREKGEKQSEDIKRLSPTISLSARPFLSQNIYVRLSYKDIFRVPSNMDKYSVVGNKYLVPEKAKQYNAGVSYYHLSNDIFRGSTFSADLFYNTIKEKIVLFTSPFFVRMINMGRVKITGYSLSSDINIKIGDAIHSIISASYTYQRAVDKTIKQDNFAYNNQIPFTPKNSGTISASVETPILNFSYSAIITGVTYNNTQNTQMSKIDQFVDHSISINKTFNIKSNDLRIQLDVTNLIDKTYYLVKYYPMPPRGYWLSVNYKF